MVDFSGLSEKTSGLAAYFVKNGKGGFVAGAAVGVATLGVAVGVNALIAGVVGATAGVVLNNLNNVASKIGKEKSWGTSKIKTIQNCSFLAVCVASIAALAALGIISTLGIILLGVASGLLFGSKVVDIKLPTQSIPVSVGHLPVSSPSSSPSSAQEID